MFLIKVDFFFKAGRLKILFKKIIYKSSLRQQVSAAFQVKTNNKNAHWSIKSTNTESPIFSQYLSDQLHQIAPNQTTVF